MPPAEQRTAAKNFAHDWLTRKGYEKGETKSFWLDLLHRVFGIDQPKDSIDFEVKPNKAKSYGKLASPVLDHTLDIIIDLALVG